MHAGDALCGTRCPAGAPGISPSAKARTRAPAAFSRPRKIRRPPAKVGLSVIAALYGKPRELARASREILVPGRNVRFDREGFHAAHALLATLIGVIRPLG
jgi:hypothetical protein